MQKRLLMGTVSILVVMIFGMTTPFDAHAKKGGKAKDGFRGNGKKFIYLQEQIDALEARLDGYEATTADLKIEMDAVRQDILDIQTQIVQMQDDIGEDIQRLEESIEGNADQKEAIRAEIAYLQGLLYEKIAELFLKVEQAETELRGSIAVLQAQNSEYQYAIEQWKDEMDGLSSALADSVAQLNVMGDKVDVNSSLIAKFQDCLNIQNDINAIQGEVNAASVQIHENTVRIADMEQQIEAMPVGTHELAMGDAVSGINFSSSSDRYWLFIGWTQLACNNSVPGYSEVRMYIDERMAESVAQLGDGAAKRSLSLSHFQMLTKGNHFVRLGLYTTTANGQDYSAIQKGKVIAIGF